MLRLSIDNGFAWEMHVKAWLVDSNFQMIDTLLAYTEVITAGNIDSDGIVYETTNSITDITITPALMDNLVTNVRYLIIEGGVQTNNGGKTVVQMLNSYSLSIAAGILIEFDADIQALTSDEE